jgi:hypothetical protein
VEPAPSEKQKHEPKVARDTRNLVGYKIETEAHPTESERDPFFARDAFIDGDSFSGEA